MRKTFALIFILALAIGLYHIPLQSQSVGDSREIRGVGGLWVFNNGSIRLYESASGGSYITLTGLASLPANITKSLIEDDASSVFSEGFDEGASKGLATLQLDGTAFDGTTGVHNIAYTGSHSFAYASLGAGQTLNLAMTATGLDIAGDQAADEGYEIFSGTLGASGRPIVIGTDPAFKFCASVKIADVSGTDDFQIGLRRAETVNAAFDDYLDAATFSVNAAAATAAIKLETILNNGATTSTDTTNTWADAATKTLCVLVSAAGVVTYTNGGAAPTVTAAFTFDDGDPVVPFIRVLQDTDLTGPVEITSWQVAYQ